MTYVEMLKEEYVNRKRRGHAYSKRAFARDLGISPAFLNLLFDGKRQISVGKALSIIKRLSWEKSQNESFVESVQVSLGGKSKNLADGIGETNYQRLKQDEFCLISDIHHVATLTLIQSQEIRNAEDIAKSFGIHLAEAQLILSRLLRLGLVRNNGKKLGVSSDKYELKEISSQAIRNFHESCMIEAKKALVEQDLSIRNFENLTLSFDPDRMTEAKLEINNFLKRFEKKFGRSKKSKVYQLNTQLFQIGDKDGEKIIFMLL